MPTQQEHDAIAARLQAEWELQPPQLVSEATILAALEARVATLLQRNPEQFFQLMYRLDVSEVRVQQVLYGDDATREVARLVYERQLQKITSRKNQPPQPPDPELEW